MDERRTLHQFVRAGLSLALPPALYATRLSRRSARIALTFDDGPHPQHTPALLDVLARLEVRATFFVLGERARRHPSVLRRIAAGGHEIGNHTFSHTRAGAARSAEWLKDVEEGGKAIEDVLGSRPRLVRPPFGKVNAAGLLSLWLAGQSVILWSVDPRDWMCGHEDALRQSLLAQRVEGGDVVLLHDDLPFAARVLPDFVRSVRARQLGFGTVSEVSQG